VRRLLVNALREEIGLKDEAINDEESPSSKIDALEREQSTLTSNLESLENPTFDCAVTVLVEV
jgi:hypothetical protein